MPALRARREAIAREWIERTFATYPSPTARFLAREQDAFRNPVGHLLREVLPAVVDEVLGRGDVVRIGRLLDRVVRLRAVQEDSADKALAFVPLLRDVVRDEIARVGDREASGVPGELGERIQAIEHAASELFVTCRADLGEIRARALRRRTWVLERMART